MTLWGRGLICRHQSLVDRFYGNESSEPHFYHRIQWLDSIIAQTERIMAAHESYSGDKLDSMLLFTHMIAHTMLLALCRTGRHSRTDSVSNINTNNVIKGYEAGTSKSVTEMLILSDALSHYGQSNVSIFSICHTPEASLILREDTSICCYPTIFLRRVHTIDTSNASNPVLATGQHSVLFAGASHFKRDCKDVYTAFGFEWFCA